MLNKEKILLCTDMDRTVIPNGFQAESEAARPLFTQLAMLDEIVLAYVSGRDLQRVLDAIQHYQLPEPCYIVADVGTNIYIKVNDEWKTQPDWYGRLSERWSNFTWEELAAKLNLSAPFQLQSKSQQGLFKLSYEITPAEEVDANLPILEKKLQQIFGSDYIGEDGGENLDKGLSRPFQIITSVDETKNQGLIDIIPDVAGKEKAVIFLMKLESVSKENTFFSGDSGNDVDVLISPIKSCLVANATDELKRFLKGRGSDDKSLYYANGTRFKNLNGNYSAGVIEGFIHHFPEIKANLDLEE